MKKIFLFAPIILFFLLAQLNFLSAQEKADLNPCGTTGKDPWLATYFERKAHEPATEGALRNAPLIRMPLTIFILTNSLEKPGGFTQKNVIDNLCTLNKDYAPSNIQFFIKDEIKIVADSALNNHSDFNVGSGLFDLNDDRSINCFFVNNAAGNCGYAFFGLYGGIVLTKGCSKKDDHTWAHEMGHKLGMPHTFSGWEGEKVPATGNAPTNINGSLVELADSSNCVDAGDGFCDTPADYLSYRWTCDAQGYGVTLKDPKGKTFKPDGHFYMSYALDACMDKFSHDQQVSMRDNCLTEKAAYVSTDPALPQVLNDTVKFITPTYGATVGTKNITLAWHPIENATHYLIQIARNALFSLDSRYVHAQDTSLVIPLLKKYNSGYYWRVRGYNAYSFCTEFKQTSFFRADDFVANEELDAVEQFNVFPNPSASNQNLNVSLYLKHSLDARIRLVDVVGRTIFTQKAAFLEGANTLELATPNLNGGMYFLILESSEGRLVQKVSKVVED